MDDNNKNNTSGCANIGVLGGAIAAMLSWEAYHSFGWVLLHSLCGWFYVLYVALIKHWIG